MESPVFFEAEGQTIQSSIICFQDEEISFLFT